MTTIYQNLSSTYVVSTINYLLTYHSQYMQEFNALSFYRSQNVLGWSKFFLSDQNLFYILCRSQTFCARPKDYFHICLVLLQSTALSFYRSQNVLGRSKFFVPDQKYVYILWQSQTLCARQKDDLHSVKLVFVPAHSF